MVQKIKKKNSGTRDVTERAHNCWFLWASYPRTYVVDVNFQILWETIESFSWSWFGCMVWALVSLCNPGLLNAESLPLWKATADLYLHRRHSNTQRQAWLSLCRVSWCTQGFVWASLVGMGFDCKHNFAPPTVFWGFSSKSWNTLIGGLPTGKFYLCNNILVPHF